MAGHSHWAGIKHKKAVIDARRGRLWSKLARNIIVAARNGGGDPDTNLALRYAIDKARDANMPNDTIDRAIKRGTGELEGSSFEEVLYEGYGPGGVAVMVQCLTDNRNRTAAEIRKIFEVRGGSLGGTNCVAWIFDKKGMFIIPADKITEEQLMEVVLEAGAEDITQEGDQFTVTCQVGDFEQVKQALKDAEIETEVAEISMIPQSTVKLDAEQGKKMLQLMEALEEQDDTQNVYANFDVPEEVMAEAG